MKTKKILATLAAAALVMVGAQTAGADEGTKATTPTVTIDVKGGNHQGAELTQGKPFIAKTVCSSEHKGYQLRLGDKVVGSGTVAEGAAGVKVLAAAEQVGKQTLTALCVSYNGSDATAALDVTIKPTLLFFEPTSWRAGDQITITGYGFEPGESVSLNMVRDADGKSYWSAANVGTADANGVFTHKLVLKSDVPLGNYTLSAKGEKSNLSLSRMFYWGRPDSDSKAPGKTAPAPGVGASKGAKKVGLPSTGA
ncbi:hypothetical protein EII34_04870 [Arachnia propionica]|uniref:Uncharacterized protein n=1 Tax=Arachnia propionica TaxID=1750 RepID=A0A3P1T9G4_9ACTN|nr:hypothetical protein [Arachnia propionica]MDO5082711.1 hypothetical protein [Arachnia propionica]RRD06019.1 hypothetical protein EII34_04870 [Arachnia propionica]